jgi:tetratricopeptide (TPR) repeat protein
VVLPLFEEAASTVEQRRFANKNAGQILSITIKSYEDARQFAKAEAWRRNWLNAVKQQRGPAHPDYAAELEGLAWNLAQQQKWTEAEAVLRECLAIRERHQAEAWTTFSTLSLLGSALLGRAGTVSDETEKARLLAEAEPLLLRGYEGMKAREQAIPSQFRVRLVEAVERLVQLYDLLDRKDEAQKWRQKLEAEQATRN